MKLLGLLLLSGLCGVALGLVRLAAEMSAPRPRCPVCGDLATDPLNEYRELHAESYRSHSQGSRVA